MKLLLCHCTELAYSDGRRSNRPAQASSEEQPPERRAFQDVLVAFVTVESSDHDAVGAAAAIRRVLLDLGRRPVLVMPFAHLSGDLAPARDAMKMLAEITAALRATGETVSQASFGFHKQLRIALDLKAHPGSVAFRSLPAIRS